MVLMNVSIPTTLKFQTTWLALQMYIFLPVNNDAVKFKETVLVFVANWNVGIHFINQALEAGYKIKITEADMPEL